MADVIFNDKGVPMMAYGKTFFASTTGAPEPAKNPAQPFPVIDDNIRFKNYSIVPWGSGNTFPQDAEQIIEKTGVLNSGLLFIRNFTLGQGVMPVKVKGYDDNGNEVLEMVKDYKINKFLRGRMFRRYMEKAARDYLKFGIAFPELLLNADGSQMVGINSVNSLECRVTEANNGVIDNVIISGNWPDNPETGNWLQRPLLDDYDPMADLMRRKYAQKVAGQNFIYPLKQSWSNRDYYPRPSWQAAKEAGWIGIANKIPQFLDKAYENQITWLWHIKIPYAYWDKRYPPEKYKDEKQRRDLIQQEMDAIENSVVGVKNARKAIFSGFEVGPTGKSEEEWVIEALDNKYKDTDKLFTSAAANSEILFSLLVNPNVLGAGMPGGTYAGNQGGSNIREAFLVNVALSWLDRQNLLDCPEMYMEYNGVQDVELRFRNTILTTLDSGSGTKKELS